MGDTGERWTKLRGGLSIAYASRCARQSRVSRFGLIAPRTKVTAKLTSDLGRANLLGVEVTATVMQPEKAGLKALSAFTVTP